MKRFFFLLVLGLAFSSALPHSGFAIGENNPTGATGEWNGSITTAGSYDPFTGNGKRAVEDIVVAGSIGAYPLKWTRVWNSRGGGGSFGNSNWWGCYTWGMWTKVPVGGYIDGEYEGPEGQITYPDGRRVELQKWAENWWVLLGGSEPMDRLVYMGNYNYDLVMRDGGRVRFIASGPPNANGLTGFSATAIIDPYGQMTTLGYDSQGRRRITEPGGRYLQFNTATFYSPGGTFSANLLSSVQAYDPSGNLIETVTYHYTGEVYPGVVNCPFFYLTSVDYTDGSHAYYTYYPAGQMDGNPWHVAAGSMKSCDDTRYAGAMKRIRYEYMAVSTAHPEVAWGQIKAEKNWAGQTVSQIEYPVYNPYQTWDPGWRKEHRGDGAIRTLQYSGGELSSYTDFLNHTSSIAYGPAPAPNQWANYLQTFTDARGNATTSEKEQEAGQVIRRTNPDGTMQTFAYEYVDGAPYYLQIRGDELGRNTYFTRDSNHRVIKVWYSYNGNPDAFPTEEFTYNNFGQVLTHKLTSGGWESFEYDNHAGSATRGLKTKHTDPLGNVTTYSYYQTGPNTDRLYMVIDPRGNATAYEYNQRGQVTHLQHQDYTYVQSGYNPDGTLAWSYDELGHTTSYTYDEYKRVLTVTNPMNETTTTNYALDPGWLYPLLHTTTNVRNIISPAGRNVVFFYDENFRKTCQASAGGTVDEAWTWFEYDAVGNLTKTTDPRGNAATFAYDNRNRQTSVTNALNQTTTIQFDGAGNKIKETRPDGAFRSWEYEQVNPMNRLVRTVDWRMSTSEPQVATQYWRNVPSTTETITDAKGAVYTFGYDLLHRKTVETYPGDAGGAVRSETWTYDAAGNLNTYTNRAGATKQFQPYDNRNRPTSFSWNNGTQGQSFAYDVASRVTALHNAEADITFGYDAANRKTSETETIKSYGLNQTHTVTYEYDADGNRSRFVYPQGWDYRLTYTNRNQLAKVQLVSAGTPSVQYTYDVGGNRSRRTIYYGAYTDYHYNAINQLDTQTSYFNGGTARFDYGFDAANRIKYEQRDSGVADGFSFDPRSELTGFNQNGTLNANGTVSAAYNVSITYDANGNRIDALDGNIAHYNSAPNNQYATDWTGTLTYDNNANLITRAGWVYGYDAQNRLVAIDSGSTHIRYHYDPLNRIVAREKNGVVTTQVWDNWNLIEEHEANDAFRRMYFYGVAANEIVGSYGPAYGDAFYFQDGRGNVTHLTGPSNNVIEHYTYFVSGQPTYLSGNSMDNRFLFEGALYVPEAEIYDMRNRFYHPNLGRFMQSDPIGFDGGDMNLFRYCGNDPVDGSDPMGLESDADLEQLSIGATLKAAKAYRTNNPGGLGRAVWGAHRKDATGYDEFPVKATIQEGYRWRGSRQRWEAYEVEATPPVNTQKWDYWAYQGHIHGRKGEKDFSNYDGDRARQRIVVTRADADDVDKNGNLKPGHTVKRAIARKNGSTETRDVYKQPETSSSGISPGMSNALSFGSLYLSFGQGAESVNFVNGRP